MLRTISACKCFLGNVCVSSLMMFVGEYYCLMVFVGEFKGDFGGMVVFHGEYW